VILVNKWDLIEKNTKTTGVFEEQIRDKIAPFTDVPIVFTSVIEKQRIHKSLEAASKVYENKMKKIPTSRLNDVMLPIIELSASGGKRKVRKDQICNPDQRHLTHVCIFL
jgi:GTP-binding protein